MATKLTFQIFGTVSDSCIIFAQILFQESPAQPRDEVLSLEEKKSRAREVTTSRLLSDADFKRIDATQLKKTVSALRKGGRKRKREEELELKAS